MQALSTQAGFVNASAVRVSAFSPAVILADKKETNFPSCRPPHISDDYLHHLTLAQRRATGDRQPDTIKEI